MVALESWSFVAVARSSPFDFVAGRIEGKSGVSSIVISARQVREALRVATADGGRPQIALARNQRFHSVAVMASGERHKSRAAAPSLLSTRPASSRPTQEHHQQQQQQQQQPAEIQRIARRLRTKKNRTSRNKTLVAYRRQRRISPALDLSTGS